MSTTPDKLVERYLKHLEVELDDLPRDRRREIVDEIAGHIAEARAGLEHETEADVRNILEGLGDPADIAEDARERFDVQPAPAAPPYKPGWIEVGALVLLLIGGLIVPIFGWLIGVVLLWVSNVWNVRDKIIGTLFVPGGLGLSILLLVFFLSVSGGGTEACRPVQVPECVAKGLPCPEGTPSTFPDAQCVSTEEPTNYLALSALILLVVTPIITTAYLGYRLRRHPAAATA
jgi:uncharacterized membrane protein